MLFAEERQRARDGRRRWHHRCAVMGAAEMDRRGEASDAAGGGE